MIVAPKTLQNKTTGLAPSASWAPATVGVTITRPAKADPEYRDDRLNGDPIAHRVVEPGNGERCL
jgi:hypothetical protein